MFHYQKLLLLLHHHHHLVLMGFTSVVTAFLICTLFLPPLSLSAPPFIHSIFPNFTTSFINQIDAIGVFLVSQNRTFNAKITSTKNQESFYLAISHSSGAIIWSANHNRPASKSSRLHLTSNGLTLYNDTGDPVWSTPPEIPPVSSLQLLESGNLVLLDVKNNRVWESFDFPTDTLVIGQKLRVGNTLVSAASEEDLSEGSYSLVVGANDAVLEWNGMSYWELSMDPSAFRNTRFPVEHLVMNFTGVYLTGDNGKETVINLILRNSTGIPANKSSFQFAKLDPGGSFRVVNVDAGETALKVPYDSCRIPGICGSLGVCMDQDKCKCSPDFQRLFDGDEEGCTPNDLSLALPGPCNGVSPASREIEYLNLSRNFDYFSNDIVQPEFRNVNLSLCQNLCSVNCSCLGIFHSQDSGSCYMIRDYFGSLLDMSSSDMYPGRLGYVKTVRVESPDSTSRNKKSGFPILAVALPLSGATGVALTATLVWFRRRKRSSRNFELGQANSISAKSDDFAWFPDLPAQFDYEEIAKATQGFKNVIGSGGFGTVYKGGLEDTTEVAVKKIDNSGAAGKREFLNEIASVGKIFHVNLVKLKGFCLHKGQRFLIYEYMNRGSLDRTIFQGEPVLEWEERYKIAIGAARGLEYLHSGCDSKIIHCDVKPENILLNDKLQVKISDFGLSKLLAREQSGFFTTLRGTRGYLAPEWLTHTAISDKTDVYGYGMVLLEIVSGAKNFSVQNHIDCPGKYEERLVNFPVRALEMHVEGRYLELVDPRLEGNAPGEEVERLVRVALCCIHRDPNLRPSMSNVVRMLEGGMALCIPKMESLNFLRFYGPGALDQNNQQSKSQEVNSAANLNNTFSYISSQQVSGPR